MPEHESCYSLLSNAHHMRTAYLSAHSRFTLGDLVDGAPCFVGQTVWVVLLLDASDGRHWVVELKWNFMELEHMWDIRWRTLRFLRARLEEGARVMTVKRYLELAAAQ